MSYNTYTNTPYDKNRFSAPEGIRVPLGQAQQQAMSSIRPTNAPGPYLRAPLPYGQPITNGQLRSYPPNPQMCLDGSQWQVHVMPHAQGYSTANGMMMQHPQQQYVYQTAAPAYYNAAVQQRYHPAVGQQVAQGGFIMPNAARMQGIPPPVQSVQGYPTSVMPAAYQNMPPASASMVVTSSASYPYPVSSQTLGPTMVSAYSQQQQPISDPGSFHQAAVQHLPERRKKNILAFVNPDTQEQVKLDSPESGSPPALSETGKAIDIRIPPTDSASVAEVVTHVPAPGGYPNAAVAVIASSNVPNATSFPLQHAPQQQQIIPPGAVINNGGGAVIAAPVTVPVLPHQHMPPVVVNQTNDTVVGYQMLNQAFADHRNKNTDEQTTRLTPPTRVDTSVPPPFLSAVVTGGSGVSGDSVALPSQIAPTPSQPQPHVIIDQSLPPPSAYTQQSSDRLKESVNNTVVFGNFEEVEESLTTALATSDVAVPVADDVADDTSATLPSIPASASKTESVSISNISNQNDSQLDSQEKVSLSVDMTASSASETVAGNQTDTINLKSSINIIDTTKAPPAVVAAVEEHSSSNSRLSPDLPIQIVSDPPPPSVDLDPPATVGMPFANGGADRASETSTPLQPGTPLEDGELADDSEEPSRPITPASEETVLEQLLLRICELSGSETWTPENQTGKQHYSTELINAIGELPASQKPPNLSESLPAELTARTPGPSNLGGSKPRGAMHDMNRAAGSRFQPSWIPVGDRHQQSFTGPPKPRGGDRGERDHRYKGSGSMGGSGHGGGGGSRHGGKNRQYTGRPSQQRHDPPVELHKADQAWNPRNIPPDDKVLMSIREILNKITPQTYDELAKEFSSMVKDDENDPSLRPIIDVLFLKAVEEPNFCGIYAQLCSHICAEQQKSNPANKSSFRNCLLGKCQIEFEREKDWVKQQEMMQEKIVNCTAEDEKKELVEKLNDLQFKEKRRVLGNMRFIGELYKRRTLIGKIMRYCILKLLEQNRDEESIECLCKLLTTTGKMYVEDEKHNAVARGNMTATVEMNSFILKLNQIKDIVRDDGRPLPSRLRFMIQDLIDLKENKWIPRRDEQGPKKIEDIHKDMEREKRQEAQNLAQYEAEKFHDRRGGGQYGRRDKPPPTGGRGSYNQYDNNSNNNNNRGRRDDRQMQQSATNTLPKDFKDSLKGAVTLSNHLYSSTEMRLGPSKPQQTSWRQSNRTSGASSSATRTTNTFNALGNVGSTGNSRESSQTREPTNRSSELGDVVNILQGMTNSATSPVPLSSVAAATSDTPPSVATPPGMSEDEIKKHIAGNVEEYIANQDLKDSLGLIHEKQLYLTEQTQQGFLDAIDKRDAQRKALCFILAKYAETYGADSSDKIILGLAQAVSMALEYEMLSDYPKFWTWVGECSIGVICCSPSGLNCSQPLLEAAKDDAAKLLAQIFIALKSVNEASLGPMWQRSTLDWTTLPQNTETKCKEKLAADGIDLDQLVITSEQQNDPSSQQSLSSITPKDESREQQIANLDVYFKDRHRPPDDIIEWIKNNISDEVRNLPHFICALSRNLCQCAMTGDGDKTELETDRLDSLCKVLVRFSSENSTLQYAVLDGALDEIRRRQFPKAMAFTIFECLEISRVIPDETFCEWYDKNEKSPGFGMIIRDGQVKQFRQKHQQESDRTD